MGWVGRSAVASAQTNPVPPVGGLGQSQSIVFEDGSAMTSRKACIWKGSDAERVDDNALPSDPCSVIPSTNSYFTANGYSTAPVQFTAANWMMRIDWN